MKIFIFCLPLSQHEASVWWPWMSIFIPFHGLSIGLWGSDRWLLNSRSIYTSVRNLALLDNLFDKDASCITLGKVSFFAPPRKRLQLIVYWRRNTSLSSRVTYVFRVISESPLWSLGSLTITITKISILVIKG